jgi:hypothetical protein
MSLLKQLLKTIGILSKKITLVEINPLDVKSAVQKHYDKHIFISLYNQPTTVLDRKSLVVSNSTHLTLHQKYLHRKKIQQKLQN